MASTSGPSSKPTTVGLPYLLQLEQLTSLKPRTFVDISSIFSDEFRRVLGGKKPTKFLVQASGPSSSVKSRSSKKGAQFGDPGAEHCEYSVFPTKHGFTRQCTWQPDSPCWLRDQLDNWNHLLNQAGFELKEHVWSQMMIERFSISSSDDDIQKFSLLVHFILRGHRCVTRIDIDWDIANVDFGLFWDSVYNAADCLTHFYYQVSREYQLLKAPTEEYELRARAITSLCSLRHLHLHGVCIDPYIAENLTEFIVQTSTLETLSLYDVKAPTEEYELRARAITSLCSLRHLHLHGVCIDPYIAENLTEFIVQTSTLETLSLYDVKSLEPDVPATFLESITKNKTLKTLRVSSDFLYARWGKSLDMFVRDHAFIETLEVDGGKRYIASSVLKAALRSKSLKVLRLKYCGISPVDVEWMSRALRRPSLTRALCGCAWSTTDVPKSSLETLEFSNCTPLEYEFEEAYASLIGGKYSILLIRVPIKPGVLLNLTLDNCSLGDKFATAAAERLRHDTRLKVLDVSGNDISVIGLTAMVDAIGTHKTLETLVFYVRPQSAPHPEAMTPLFEAIRHHRVSSRLCIFWWNPSARAFSEGTNLCAASVLGVALDRFPDVGVLLDGVAASRSISTARLISSVALGHDVIRRLADVVRDTRHLRCLHLCVPISALEAIGLLTALKQNTSVEELELAQFTFDENASRALRKMVSVNRRISKLTISIWPTPDIETEALRVCHALREALCENHTLSSLVVEAGEHGPAKMSEFKNLVRRNMMQVHEAAHFVMGASAKRHALAFDVQKESRVLRETVSSSYNLTEDQAAKKIAEARYRLAMNYLYYTGVVRHHDMMRQPPLRRIGVNILVRVFGLLSLQHVLSSM
ncbi:hypothetical protein HPB50_015162 [Hyalomma asiaticum]|uniref:Uncharacterized protein n=1 Tax=Hyalomma asiaticum TaxID=266040 RepID=A0ACB7RI64_HYAAI|nr:hypothetical protein HPB50_015162 [Hyalomma asiaticum]